MRILIADDDVVLRHSLRVYLERWEYDVVECADGAAAFLKSANVPIPPWPPTIASTLSSSSSIVCSNCCADGPPSFAAGGVYRSG